MAKRRQTLNFFGRRYALTLAMCWIRTIGASEELFLASDSRLTGGLEWDAAQKVFVLGHSRFAISFAGDTIYAYPFLQQIQASVSAFRRANDGVLDGGQLRSHILKLMNGMMARIKSMPIGVSLENEMSKMGFILAGFDWRSGRFKLFKIHYSRSEKKFTFATRRGQRLLLIGDHAASAKRMVMSLTRAINKPVDMEPFSVLRDIVLDPEYTTIGGPLQLVKISRHGNAMPFSVYSPSKEAGVLTFAGRPLQKYERYIYRQIDPSTMEQFDGYAYTW